MAYGQAIEAEKFRARGVSPAPGAARACWSSSSVLGRRSDRGARRPLPGSPRRRGSPTREGVRRRARTRQANSNGTCRSNGSPTGMPVSVRRSRRSLPASGAWCRSTRSRRIESEGPEAICATSFGCPLQLFVQDRSVGRGAVASPLSGQRELRQDTSLRLTRGTDWVDQPWGQAGIGQHEWSAQRRLRCRHAVAEAPHVQLMAASRLNPTLFDKLVADLEIEGLHENQNDRRIHRHRRLGDALLHRAAHRALQRGGAAHDSEAAN